MSTFIPPPPRTELLWAAVDLDNTLAEGVWTPDSDGRAIGEPLWHNVEKLEELVEHGYKIAIHSSRSWEAYETIEAWLRWHCIPFDRIVLGKLLAKAYVDDRGVHEGEDSWLPSGPHPIEPPKPPPAYRGKHCWVSPLERMTAVAYDKFLEYELRGPHWPYSVVPTSAEIPTEYSFSIAPTVPIPGGTFPPVAEKNSSQAQSPSL